MLETSLTIKIRKVDSQPNRQFFDDSYNEYFNQWIDSSITLDEMLKNIKKLEQRVDKFLKK